MQFEWLVLVIPVIAAFIGWGTNVVAVKMMFYPVDFVGLRPIGWQGIIPANAKSLARKSTELITTKLIDLKALFENFDAAGFSDNLEGAIDELTDQIIAETATKYAAAMWDGMADSARAQVRAMIRGEVKNVTIQILADMGERIEDILDITDIVVDVAERDRALVGEMFQQVGLEEFRFIKRSGAYFGLLFGIVQMFAWLVYPVGWVLPAFGFLVGYATNWLAIKLIFEPAEPVQIGPFTIQGLFHKRQQEVAKKFATMVSGDILNPDNMVLRMVEGPTGGALFGIVEKRVGELLERYRDNPLAAALVPAGEWPAIEAEIHQRIREELPKPGGFLYTFVSQSIDVYGNLFDSMTVLDPESFEGVMRPAFQQDEWKLILAGAVLGTGAGVLQLFYIFGESLV